MFKGIVTKLAKEVWDSASNPSPAPTPPRAEARIDRSTEEQAEAADPTPHVETDIEFPYYPGQGTACGSACRCRWRVEVRWSDADRCNATYATWQTAGDSQVCPDCQKRAGEWHDVLVRLEST